MTASLAPSDSHSDRIKLPMSFDVDRMLSEVQNMGLRDFIYYNVIPLRAPAHMIDPTHPAAPSSSDDYADGSWTEWLDSGYLKDSPYLLELVDQFREHTKVTLVRILRLEAGAVVKEHTDPTLGLHIEKSVIRLTVPILWEDEVEFHLNGTPVPMKPGECWYLRLTDPHSIINASQRERISLTVDMIPNDWVRDLILQPQ